MKIPNPYAAFMAFACALFAACSPQQPFITSPDGRIAVSVEADAGAGVTYAVTVDDKPLILPSAMGLAACGTSLQGATITGVWHSSHDGLWTAPWGENKRHRNRYNEMSVAVRKPDKSMAFTRIRRRNSISLRTGAARFAGRDGRTDGVPVRR